MKRLEDEAARTTFYGNFSKCEKSADYRKEYINICTHRRELCDSCLTVSLLKFQFARKNFVYSIEPLGRAGISLLRQMKQLQHNRYFLLMRFLILAAPMDEDKQMQIHEYQRSPIDNVIYIV
ncbi:unnamed protein product [Amoebophrya sp. A120]|nr:unnamed protein product [Amoebophrya sp. A120]|eukprot:GSA120T00004293001.1